jgi:P protein
MHMSACIFFATIVAFFQIKWMFKTVNDLRFDEPSDVQKLRHEISIWHRSATSLSPYSKDEEIVRKSLMKKVERLQVQLEKKLKSGEVATESYIATLEELEKKYPIKNKMLLFKSCIALIFVITFFFLHSVPNLQKLSLGWTALLGAVLLLILYDREDMEAILHHVEWATLLFFAALFVLMEALAELGLIEWIGKQTVSMILSVGEGARLAVAILIILWVINRISCGKIINFCFFL